MFWAQFGICKYYLIALKVDKVQLQTKQNENNSDSKKNCYVLKLSDTLTHEDARMCYYSQTLIGIIINIVINNYYYVFL